MGLAEEMTKEEYTWVHLLQNVCMLENSPNHKETAIRNIYAGMNQISTENMSTFLERVRQTGEDAFGLCSSWSNSNASTILGVIINGVRNKQVLSMIATYIITMPVNFSKIKQHLVEFENRAPKTPKTEIHAINANPNAGPRQLVCYRCSGEHIAKNCKISYNNVKCTKCNKNGHSTKNHHLLMKMLNNIQEEKPEAGKESGVYLCQPEATSFITGEINVENTGDKFVVCPKILIDTGALVPSGIAVSKDFFVNHLGGELSRLRPSQLLSANGATTTGSMTTLGEVTIEIRFTNINITFNGTAVVLKNLSLPIILGVNFLKTHSLSTFLTPNAARLVHTPSQQSQALIASLRSDPWSLQQCRSRPTTRQKRTEGGEISPPRI